MERRNRKTTLKVVLFILPSLVLLSGCDSSALQEDLRAIGTKLIPNVWAFLVQFIALIVMLIIVIKLAYKPVHKFLENRKKILKDEVDETEKARNEANRDKELAHKSISEAKTKANNIIKEAEQNARNKSEKILADTQNEVKDLKEKSLKEIEEAKKKAIKELNDEIVDVAFDASSKILEREVNKKDNSKIVEDFLKELDKKEDK